jgi:cell division protease FtsH
MTLGGRAAESVVFDKISTGAQNDLDRVTKMAYGIVAIYGMNDKVGNVSFYDMENKNTFRKPYSEETSSMIDHETRTLIQGQYDRAKNLLRDKYAELTALANELLEKEVLLKSDVERLLGPRPVPTDDVISENLV